MKSVAPVPRQKQPSRRKKWPNTIFFPRALREAIPDMPTCEGRILVLSAMSGKGSSGPLRGKRIELSLEARETGKLSGVFEVWVDMDVTAARGMLETLERLVTEAEAS